MVNSDSSFIDEENLKEKTSVHLHHVFSQEELKNADEALEYALETEGFVLDPVKEKKVLRKIDYMILPMMCMLMTCQLMDKATNSYASIVGLRTDLKMTSQEYSWVASSFYLGYLVFEYPANMLLQKFPLSKTLTFAVISWGVVICCHGACHSSSTFLLCRTLLGLFESFMDPAYMIMTSQWYRKEEQYIRCGFWLGMQGFGTMLGSGIAYGFYIHKNSFSFAPWRLLYIVTGVITIFFGIVSFFHIPDIPSKAWFLNDEEKKYVVERIRKNRTGFGNKTFKFSQFKEAIMDPCIYLFFFYMVGYGISNGSVGNFGSILLSEEFHFSTGNSLLMNMVGSGIDIIFPLAFALVNHYLIPSRLAVGLFINVMVFIGVCMLAFAPESATRLGGFYLTYLTTASWACMSSIVSTNVGGHTKKITANTSFLIGFCVGNMIGPQAFLGKEAPIYFTGKKVMVGTYVLTLISQASLLGIYMWRNKKKMAKDITETGEEEEELQLEFGDLTDEKNPKFIYVL
ncbi:hypothetical protein C6P40_000683 [Pichia californica]|uniref:Allantoate permease n=1 Tax=Pichia californica TaxID=460514 RepID=A0A9P7BG04_9ASCO|nr:hypothetical protein C6P42_000738 [[Candida] californica]KAG0688670.1 hypothetical protein C6P40_000683 [[Candida] californica]